VELVLEVDDVAGERDRVLAAGWPLEEDLQERPWGLTDFRILDPAGYYLRITDRAPA
jgi:lactoylglutathione lyase